MQSDFNTTLKVESEYALSDEQQNMALAFISAASRHFLTSGSIGEAGIFPGADGSGVWFHIESGEGRKIYGTDFRRMHEALTSALAAVSDSSSLS